MTEEKTYTRREVIEVYKKGLRDAINGVKAKATHRKKQVNGDGDILSILEDDLDMLKVARRENIRKL